MIDEVREAAFIPCFPPCTVESVTTHVSQGKAFHHPSLSSRRVGMSIIVWYITLVLCPTVATSCGFREFFDQNLEGQHGHGQSDPLAVPQLGSCASSGRAWRLLAAVLPGRGRATGLPATALCSSYAIPKPPIPSPVTIQERPGIHKWEHYFSAYEQECRVRVGVRVRVS